MHWTLPLAHDGKALSNGVVVDRRLLVKLAHGHKGRLGRGGQGACACLPHERVKKKKPTWS